MYTPSIRRQRARCARSQRLRRLSTLLLLIFIFLTGVSFTNQNVSIDLLLLKSGNVITMNDAMPSAEAIAIKNGRIIWVGSNADANKLFSGAAETEDLHGATVLPGILDVHTHMLNLGQSFLKLNLKDISTVEGVVERVREAAKTAAPGEWILGWGWDEGKWASPYPNHAGLTQAAPNNPVVLAGLHGFASWVNKKSLDLAGITKQTKDPENGKIIRDSKTDEPTGVLTNTAQQLIERQVPPLSKDQIKKAIQLAALECARNGLTSVDEAKVSPEELQAYRELIREGKMPLRVYVMLDGANKKLIDAWLEKGPLIEADGQLNVRSVKIFADGALGSRGAALFEPYSDAPTTKGVMTTPEADIYDLTSRCLKRGFRVCTHAIGDAANHRVLDAYERAMRENPKRTDARLRIEHAQVLAPDDIPRFAKLKVIASMQAVHCTSDMPWAEKRVGPVRIKGAYAWRSLLNTGAHVSLSSDFPGETLNPFAGMYSAITRQDSDGKPAGGWDPDQRMTIKEALRSYTREAAYAEFSENEKGSIEIGKLADLTIIDRDITRIEPKELLTVRVLKTFVGGRKVYEIETRR